MDVIIEYADLVLSGLKVTTQLLIISLVLGFVFAVGVGIARISNNRLIAYPAFAFTSVIRGTPLLVQIYIYYYGLGTLFSQMPGIRSSFL